MVTIKNFLLYVAVVVGMMIAILQCRVAWADGCEGGFVGQTDIYYPDGTHDIDMDNLTYLYVDVYKFVFVVSGETHIVPRDAMLDIYATNVDCTYHIAYNADPIFHDGFEVP